MKQGKRKEYRECRLCGAPYYSNKKLYCSLDHCRVWRLMIKGSNALTPLLALLEERQPMGARIEGFWASGLKQLGWIEEVDKFSKFTAFGLSRLELLKKEQKAHGQRKAKID